MDDALHNLLGIPAEDWAQTPESVRLVVRSLVDIVESLRAELRTVTTQVQELQAQVGQTSRNSSKPPSSDPPSAPPTLPRTPRGRKAGGQVGHEGQQRPLVPPDQVDVPIDLRPDSCPHCHTDLAPSLPDASPLRRTQVWDLPPIIPIITEYRQHTLCCPQCRELVTAVLPPDAPPGAFGPGVTALMSLMRGHYRFSLDAAEEFLAEVCNLPISSGSIVTSCERVSDALAPVDAAIQEAVLAHPQVNADETSWPTETRKGWLWVAVCAIATCFRVHPSRGKAGLRAVLGETYRGIVGSDRLGTYKQFAPGQRQLCWAHLLRNLLGLLTRYADDQRWAQRMLALSDDLFFAWHAYKEGWYDQIALQQALIPVRLAMYDLLREGTTLPYPKIAGFSRELLKQWDALWTFSRVEGVEPTNNAAERALRPAVLWRKGSFGSRSAAGCRFAERMLSVCATCAQQGRPRFAFITEAVRAAWAGEPAPTLILTP
jgi:transposase